MEVKITAAVFVIMALILHRASYKAGYAKAQSREKAKEQNFSIEEVCPHHVVEVKVLCHAGTCETTVEQCEYCKKILTDAKTDC